MKWFNNLAQSAVNAWKEKDENSNASVEAEQMTLLANNSHGYQNMERSRHTVSHNKVSQY